MEPKPGDRVTVDADYESPYNSVFNDPGDTTYAGQSGIIQAQNTMDESLVKFDDPEMGSRWIGDNALTVQG